MLFYIRLRNAELQSIHIFRADKLTLSQIFVDVFNYQTNNKGRIWRYLDRYSCRVLPVWCYVFLDDPDLYLLYDHRKDEIMEDLYEISFKKIFHFPKN